MKGLIIVYVNFLKDDNQDKQKYLSMVRDDNKVWLERIEKEGDYGIMFVPTMNEASRTEKIDFDAPFPTVKKEQA